MAISFPRFNALNLGQVAANQEAVRGARIRNSILGMQEQDQRRQGQQRERIRQIRSMTDNAGEAIQLLEAEWTYLNRPDRLARLAKRYLPLKPPAPDAMRTMADVPGRFDSPHRVDSAAKAEISQ